MKDTKKWTAGPSLPILFGFIVYVLILNGCSGEKVHLKIGDAAPKAVLQDLTGSNVSLPDGFKGKLVVLRFWADWCKSCEIEMPALDRVYKGYAGKGIVILAINVGQTKEIAGDFARKLELSYPVLLDPGSKTAKNYGVVGLPTTIIIDRDGRLKKKIIGETGGDAMEKIVAGLL
ncbi:MAG: TlpA family protein disulfide reductase [Nitrospirae bacterium]|nr:MAG: TlpA family protein disulfide reductase [Nitrospirota bacterium]